MIELPFYLRQLPVGPMKNFVYLLGPKDSPETLVVDPAWDLPAIERALETETRKLSGVIVSHSHFDHINALVELLERHDVPVYAQKAEVDFSEVLQQIDAVKPAAPGERVELGSFSAALLHTPGHTPGSQCVLCAGALVTGDTLFVNACGRCDLDGGDPREMYESLSMLKALPESTAVLPGHDYGDVRISSIARERAQNPYLSQQGLASFLAYRGRPRT